MTLKGVVEGAINNFNIPEKRYIYINTYDDACIIHGFPEGFNGKEGLKQFYSMLWQAFPDLRVSIDDMIEEDDKVSVRFTTSGTHKGEFLGLKPTDKQISFDSITILKFANNKIVERWQCTNEIAMLKQLGVI
jgi:steroid delta-isomerase-like uncharacterized protein